MAKISISLGNYHKPTPAKAKKWANFIKAILAAAGGSSLVMGSPTAGFFIMVAAGGVNEFFELIAVEDDAPANV